MIKISPLTIDKFRQAVQLVLRAKLDTKEEIEHHLEHLDAHYIALDGEKVVGVIGWYQDNVNYATKAMGDKFPGEDAYWVGFFAVDKNYQGQGIDNKLVTKLEEVLKNKEVDELWVSSVPETRSYYEEHGFRVVMEGEINSNPKVFMKKDLK